MHLPRQARDKTTVHDKVEGKTASVPASVSVSVSVSAGNDGDQLSSALVWQGAKFLAVQDDALLVGVDECVVLFF